MHYLQISDERELSPLRKRCVQSVKDVMVDGDTYEMINIKTADNIANMAYESDKIKFQKAKEIKDLCYVDTDCFIHKALDVSKLKENTPYFCAYTYHGTDTLYPDVYYFYVNGNCDFFKKNFGDDVISPSKYGVSPNLLMNLKGMELIDQHDYIHMYETLRKMVDNEKNAPTMKLMKKYESLLRKLSTHVQMSVTDIQEFNEAMSDRNT